MSKISDMNFLLEDRIDILEKKMKEIESNPSIRKIKNKDSLIGVS